MSLEEYGWSDFFSTSLPPELEPARVVLTSGDSFRLVGRDGELVASVAGRLKHEASSATELPTIGDWVGLRENRIEKLLPRRTHMSRKVAGRRTEEQIVAANIDTVVVVMGLDRTKSRIERRSGRRRRSGRSGTRARVRGAR